MKNGIRFGGELYMLACVLMWSTGGVLIKLMQWNSFMIAGVRSALAVIILIAYMIISKKRLKLSKFTVFTIIGMCTNFFSYITATQMTTAANSIMLASTHPVFIILIYAIFFKQFPTKREITTVLMCFAGMALFFLGDLDSGALTGNLLALLSGLGVAMMYTCSAKANDVDTAVTGLLCGHTATALIGIPLGLGEAITLDFINIGAILFLGLIQTGLAYVFFNFAVTKVPPLNCSLICMIEPILNPIFVFIVVREVPSITALAGSAVVVLTILWWTLGNINQASNA